MEVESDLFVSSKNGSSADASYSRKDWFMKQAERSSSHVEGLTGQEAEEILLKGLEPSSQLLRGDPTEIAARVTAIISAAHRMVSKEKAKIEAIRSEKEECMHECKILKSKLKDMEKERNELLRSNLEMKDRVKDEVMEEIMQERNEWQGKINSLLEEISDLKGRNTKLAAAEEELTALKESIASKEEQVCENSFELQNANVRLDFVEKKLDRIIQNVTEEFSTLKGQKEYFEAEVVRLQNDCKQIKTEMQKEQDLLEEEREKLCSALARAAEGNALLLQQTKDIREQAEAHLQVHEEQEQMRRREESLGATINVLKRKNEQAQETMGKQRTEIAKLWEMIRRLKEQHGISEDDLSRLHKRVFRADGREEKQVGSSRQEERWEEKSRRSAVDASYASRSMSSMSSESVGIFNDPVSQWVRGLRAEEAVSRMGRGTGGKPKRTRRREETSPAAHGSGSVSFLGSASSGRHLSGPLQKIKQQLDEDVRRERCRELCCTLLGNEWDLIVLERLWGRQISPGLTCDTWDGPPSSSPLRLRLMLLEGSMLFLPSDSLSSLPGTSLSWDVFLDVFTPSLASQNAMKDAHNSALSPSKVELAYHLPNF
eukprot:752525-Hanusia_phi.AAC.3